MQDLEFSDILRILPHRYPMLMVDRIVECDFEKTIVGIKNLTINEPFFQGHFPDNPIMPGVLQLEAMAQVGGVLLNTLTKEDGRVAYFTAVNNCKFRRLVVPGDQLRIEIELLKLRLGMAKVHGITRVEGEVASEADLMFGAGRK